MLQKSAIETLKLNNLRMEVYVSLIERRKHSRERSEFCLDHNCYDSNHTSIFSHIELNVYFTIHSEIEGG